MVDNTFIVNGIINCLANPDIVKGFDLTVKDKIGKLQYVMAKKVD